MTSKCRLTYFTLKGLGEPIRYMLSYRNIKFEDVRLDMETWKATVKHTAPFGKAPVLEIDGKVLTQSKAICRYMAREAGIAGKDTWEDLQIDMMIDTIEDVRTAAADYKFERDEKKKAEKKDPLYNETIPFYFKKFETIVSASKGHLANKKELNSIQLHIDAWNFILSKVPAKLTWADIYFVAISEHMCFLIDQDILEPYPNLKALKDTIHAIPGIKKYVEQRPADILVEF